MSWLLPLTVAVPLLTAAFVVATDHVFPVRLTNAVAIAGAGVTTAFAVLAMVQAEREDTLHWFGGWEPRRGVAVGIDFTGEPLGAGMTALASGLTLVALVYSWTFLREASRLVDALLLVFCGAACGFSLTGDLFNMFVWFELMGVAAYALAGFQVEELGPVQGAFNFAITNTVGAYMLLLGIALLYARTGALNLAQIGQALSGQAVDGLLLVAVTLVLVGFFVKAAVVPFHMWASDAHAVAPAPVAALFSAVELQLGLLGVVRVYWTVFDAPLGADQAAVRNVLLGLGVASALVGAVMCFLQRHLKRLLAYSTISHSGLILVGVALLDPTGLAGAANLVLSHAFLKTGLFLAAGILLASFRSIDELGLHGKGREQPLVGVLWALGAVGLIGIPYVGSFLGHSLVDHAGANRGWHWIQPLLAIASAVSAGAILRAGARIFLGWGPRRDDLLTTEPPEDRSKRDVSYTVLVIPTAVVIVLGLAASLGPGLQQRSEQGAERFQSRTQYVAEVLRGQPPQRAERPPYSLQRAATESIAWGIAGGVMAILVAAFGLWRSRIPAAVRRVSSRMLDPPVTALKVAHSGIVGDYLMWITLGTALVGGVWALTLH